MARVQSGAEGEGLPRVHPLSSIERRPWCVGSVQATMAGGEGGRGARGLRGVIRIAGVRWSCGRRLGLFGREACGIVARKTCVPGPGTGGPLAPNFIIHPFINS